MDDRNRIVDVSRQITGKPINPSSRESLFEAGLLDSFALTDFVPALEKEILIHIPDSDTTGRKFDTVDRIETYLQSRA